MIHFTTGNILKSDAEALVNTVNTVGIMGKGIALAFKNKFPENYRIYRQACDNKELKTGRVLLTTTGRFSPKYIINFPTKQHWRGNSKMDYITEGMKNLVEIIREKNIKSIAIPPLGSGNGGLDWKLVKPVILKALTPVKDQLEIYIYEPGFNNQAVPNKQEIQLTPARAMLLMALNKYKVLGYAINLLVAQKLAYFMQRLGEPLNLKFEKGFYGPYSHQLQHLLKYLNGWYLQFRHEQTSPGTTMKLNHIEKVEEYSKNNLSAQQKERLSRLETLIEGFESPYGLELLATVDFIQQQSNKNKPGDIEKEIGQWTNRKKELMKPYHIEVAHQRVNRFFETTKQVY
jgi:O-acetyl-ADP-ribose deacetylase (regulator of RNase III)